MKVYLLRHGLAGEHIDGNPVADHKRALTSEGKAEVKSVAFGLKKIGVRPQLIVTSPLTRAKQTAQITAEVFGYAEEDIEITDRLSPGVDAHKLFKYLQDFEKANEIILVGHEPDMAGLVSAMLWAGSDFEIAFKKAGICRIDLASMPPTSPGVLRWFLTPKIASLAGGK
jgi:phosphohistidine phosphatase